MKKSQGSSSFGINDRSFIPFREIGIGYACIETFCATMNMPSAMNKTAYVRTISKLHEVYGTCAVESMKGTAADILSCNPAASTSTNDNAKM